MGRPDSPHTPENSDPALGAYGSGVSDPPHSPGLSGSSRGSTSALSSYLRMIKFSHSIFALPFAFTAAILAARGLPSLEKTLWIALAMVSGRTAAMGMNRIIDRHIDAVNPRTRNREIPAGVIGAGKAAFLTVLSCMLFVVCAWMLNPLCLKFSPLALGFFVLYSYTKRFTWLSHVVLGITISLAPLGAWIAITGAVGVPILPLVGAVLFWLAGFDVLYALQDLDFDRAYGLHSIPQQFGPSTSLWIARVFHFLAWVLLLGTAAVFHLGISYYIGLALVTGLLVYEHALVKEDNLSKIDMAFFNMNGYISITIFLFIFLDVVILRRG